MMVRKCFLASLIALALAGCGGGGGGSAVSPTTGNSGMTPGGSGGSSTGTSTKTPQSVQLNMHIPGASSTSSTKRGPQFIASSTQGVLVDVYATSDTTHSTLLGSSATNVAPGSAACGGASGPRTCTVTIPAPPGQDDFVFTTYDQPPTSGTTFPSNAKLLASGAVINQTINVASANVVNVTLGGTVNTTQAYPYNYNLIAAIGPQTYQMEFTALDAAGNIIIGPYYDANGNSDPITVTVNETGGSGFTKIAVGTATPSTTATVTSSSDVITVSYSGGGTIGYGVSYSAIAATGQPLTPTFGPMFISANSPAFTPATSPTVNATLNLTTPNQTVNFTVGESNPYSPANIFINNCTGIVTATTPTSGPTETFSITGGSTGGSCTLVIGFNFVSYDINVTAPSNTSATVAVPGTTLAYLAQGASGVAIDSVSGTPLSTVTTATPTSVVAIDNAGNLYTATSPNSTNTVPGSITKYTPGAGYPPAYTASSATYNLTDGDHLVWIQASGAGELAAFETNFTANTTTVDVWDPGASGNPSRTFSRTSPTGSNSIFFGGQDTNGNIYVAYYASCGSGNFCVKYDMVKASTGALERTISESIVPQANQTYFAPNYAAVGPDGTFYVTEWNFVAPDPNEGIYVYPPTGPERFISTYYSPNGIDLDATGNIYVVGNNSNYATGSASLDTNHILVELSPDGSTNLKTTQFTPNPYQVTVAPDGTAIVAVFPNTSLNITGGTYVVPPSAYNPVEISTIAAGQVVLWNGSQQTLSKNRSAESLGSGSAHGGGFFSIRRR